MIKTKNQIILTLLSCCFLGIFVSTKAYGQQDGSSVTLTGRVQDVAKESLVGASVLVKGTTNGTVTDFDGNYKLVCNSGDIVSFSYLGYITKDVKITNQKELNITLDEDNNILDDVVVIGYGTTTRKHIIGATDQVGAKVIENRPVANLTQALQGVSPSLTIQQRNMDPNDNTININIRGVNTTTSNTPLVVIDGMISDVSNMNKLNPADIDNISVLKDAGSAAIYGSRSASGVIIITTKQGKKNTKPQVRFSSLVGVQTPKILYSPLEGWQNATMMNIALANGGKSPAFTPAQIQDLKDHGDAEWMMDYIFKDALHQSYNLSVSGGSENTTYMVSGGYFDQESNFIGPNYGIDRYNLRTNITTEYNKFKLNVILGYTRQNAKGDEGGGFKIADAGRTPKYYYNAVKTADGRYINHSIGGNVAALLEQGGFNKHSNDQVNIGTSLDYSITKDLKAKGVFGYDLTSNSRFIRRFQYDLYAYGSDKDSAPTRTERASNDAENYSFKGTFINTQLMLDYNKEFGKHRIAGLLGVSQEVLDEKSSDAKMRYVDPELGIPVSEGSQSTIFDDTRTEINGTKQRVIQSLFGRVSYSYADKYYGEATFRTDGSSRFPSNERWGTFPSFSVGWRPTEESFMEDYKSNIGDLKLRSSWGILGNQEIGDYQYFKTYTIYSNTVGFNNTAYSGTGFLEGNPLLTWEKVRTFNVGLDMSFLKNSLNVNFDYFNQKTTDILRRPVTPSTYGTDLGDVNIGTMKNQGWELNMSYSLKHSAFSHMFSFNIANTQNKVVDLGYEEISTSDNIAFIVAKGLPLGAYYGFKTDGYFQSYDEIANSALPVGITPEPGDVKYIDRNEDGVIDNNDRYYLGDGFPHYTFGFTYNVEYKNFDFSLLAQGVGKRNQALRGDIYVPFHNGSWFPAMFKHQLDTWTPVNTDARFPRLVEDSSPSFTNNWGYASDIYLLDAAYLRLKNIQLGYSLPANIAKKLTLQKVRFYVNAQNLFTLSKNSFIDPESSEFGSELNKGGANSGRNYPTLKYYGFGIDIEF